jgi:hypothetical protein
MEATYISETSVDFNGLHGVIYHNIKFFTTTTVRTSNPEAFYFPAPEFIELTVHIGSQWLIYMSESQYIDHKWK